MSNILKIAGAGVSAAAEDTDEYFNQTVLLLHGDGTDGDQNNEFLDSGTANSGSGFTITRNPASGPNAPTQGTFSPFSAPDGRWSNYFDGSGDYLTVADSADFDLAGDYTIDFWVFPLVSTGLNRFFMIGDYRATYNGLDIYTNASNEVIVYSNGATIITGGAVNPFAWNYISLVRSGGGSNNTTLYVNGVAATPITDTTSFTGVAGNGVSLGLEYSGAGTSVTTAMYLANVRLVNGTAITPSGLPTSPASTSTTNQKLLTCYSNRFVDANTATTAKTVTVNGNPKVTPFSPFAPTAAYDAAVNGGSGYFDGTGDYLSVADDADLDFGTGNLTVSGWLYKTTGANASGMMVIDGRASDNTAGWVVYETASGALEFWQSSAILTSSSALTPNQWNYFHISRSGSSAAMYINGVSVASATNTTSLVSDGLNIGAKQPAASTIVPWQGYMADISVIKGTATSNAVPTAPTTSIANTSLLLNFTNAAIFDNTGKNVLETVGNAQIDTTTKKYGTGSMEFDGTGDYLVTSDYLDYNFGSGDFTIECFANFSASVNGTGYTIAARAVAGFTPNSAWTFWRTNTASSPPNADSLRFIFSTDGGATNIVLLDTPTFRPTTGVWYHLAVTRSGSTFRIFIDGVSQSLTTTQLGTATTSSTIFNSTRPLYIGATADNANNFNGFMDDLRITKGVARYTTTFTPPTKAYPDL